MQEDRRLEMSIDRNIEEVNELLTPELRRKRTIRWAVTALLGVLIYYLLWNYYWFRWTLILYVSYKLMNIIPVIFWQTYTTVKMDRIETQQKELYEKYTKPIMYDDILYMLGEYVKMKPNTVREEDYAQLAEQWEQEFCESAYMNELTDYQKEHAGFIVSTFLDYIYNYEHVLPNEWETYDVQNVCLGPVPRKITAEIELFENYGDVLIIFLRFLEDQGYIPISTALQETVRDIKDEIPEIAGDSSNWGITKSFMMEAQDSGVDLLNKKEVDKYLMGRPLPGMANMLKGEVTEPVRKPRLKNIGRNERVTVKYKNGKQIRDIKFKKVEQDLLDGKCEIIDS